MSLGLGFWYDVQTRRRLIASGLRSWTKLDSAGVISMVQPKRIKHALAADSPVSGLYR